MNQDLRDHINAALAAEYQRQQDQGRSEWLILFDSNDKPIYKGWLVRGSSLPYVLIERNNSRHGRFIDGDVYVVAVEKGEKGRDKAQKVEPIWSRPAALAELQGLRDAAWAQVEGRAWQHRTSYSEGRHLYRFVSRGNRHDKDGWNSERIGECAGCGVHCGPNHGGEPCSHCDDRLQSSYGFEEWTEGEIVLIDEDQVEAKVAELAEAVRAKKLADEVRHAEILAERAERDRQEADKQRAFSAQLDAIEQAATGPRGTLADLKRRIQLGTRVETLLLPYTSDKNGMIRFVDKIDTTGFRLEGSRFDWPKATDLAYVGDTIVVRDRGYGRAYRIVDSPGVKSATGQPFGQPNSRSVGQPNGHQSAPMVGHYTRCQRCGKPLSGDEAKRRGYGNDCWNSATGAPRSKVA